MNWIAEHFLQLNGDKTEVLVLVLEKVTPMIMQSIIHSNLRNLGTIFDQFVTT